MHLKFYFMSRKFFAQEFIIYFIVERDCTASHDELEY